MQKHSPQSLRNKVAESVRKTIEGGGGIRTPSGNQGRIKSSFEQSKVISLKKPKTFLTTTTTWTLTPSTITEETQCILLAVMGISEYYSGFIRREPTSMPRALKAITHFISHAGTAMSR